MPQVGPEIEVVVIDNASSETLDLVRAAWPQLRIVTERRKGAAEARNLGVGARAALGQALRIRPFAPLTLAKWR